MHLHRRPQTARLHQEDLTGSYRQNGVTTRLLPFAPVEHEATSAKTPSEFSPTWWVKFAFSPTMWV